jgi:NAD(P)-dependent dehydrogenase (short-subunit alcohol dehydrogenase family)
MSVFITGSADGLGHTAAQTLVDEGHQVAVHARTRIGSRPCAPFRIGAPPATSVHDQRFQDHLLEELARITGTPLVSPGLADAGAIA